jgi:WhiB family redox-sensing transcriptional regulator
MSLFQIFFASDAKQVFNNTRVITTMSSPWRVGRIGAEYMAFVDESNTQIEESGWWDYANCLGVDPDLFFPERGASTKEAKEVCRGCIVREDCLEYALSHGEKFGIWGGMSERERRRLRRQRALARRAAAERAS